MIFRKLSLFIPGLISGLVFAPVFFIPGLFALSILCYRVQNSLTWQQAVGNGFIFGFGHFLSSTYWVVIGVSVYIDEFWWALPFALLGIPLVLACFIAAAALTSWQGKNTKSYHFIFCLSFVFFEWLRSWLFTGLPWNLLGYALSFSDILIQPVNLISIYGLGFIVVYISTCIYSVPVLLPLSLRTVFINPLFPAGRPCNIFHSLTLIFSSILVIILMLIYGAHRLERYPTQFTNIKVRLVQPSIPQIAKWDPVEFWKNFNLHVELSLLPGDPDLIIWSEAALIVPYKYKLIKEKLEKMLQGTSAILMSGGITEEQAGEDTQIYTSFFGLDAKAELFNYHKTHLVPFGEYMPFKNILPIKKLTPGFLDYTKGKGENVSVPEFDLQIRPLICYEAIFPEEVRTSTRITDVFINVTNDAWYGKSSEPYQHLHISRMRAVENGIPLLRAANNGISAIIDPLGRIVAQLNLNEINIIDGFIPLKLKQETIFSQFGNVTTMLSVVLMLVIQLIIKFLLKSYIIIYKNT